MDINKMMKDLVKVTDNEYASIVTDGTISTVNEYYSTGVYLLNAQISGDIYKGIPGGKTIILAGDPSCGKSFFSLSIAKNFLKEYENGILVYIDTEHAVDKKMFEERRMDTNRILYLPIDTIENYRTQVTRILNEFNKKDDVKAMIITDSSSRLTSKKEVGDIEEGKDTLDMTKQKLLKGAFRVFGLKMAKHNITHIVTAHVYGTMDMFSRKVVSGGMGSQYEGSYVVMLSKAQNKEGTEVTGAIITSKLEKARYTKEKTKVKTLLSFKRGLHPYYELPQFCVEHKIWEKPGNKYVVNEDTKVFEKELLKNPAKYFTEDVMCKINEKCKEVFNYDSHDKEVFADEVDEVETSEVEE